MKQMLILALLGWSFSVLAQTYSNTFTQTWQDVPWAAGGITPTGSVMSLDGMIDADGDGNGEFLMSSSWSGAFGNDAILYEASGDSFVIAWYYWFNNLDLTNYNYSACTTGDLDADGLPELIFLNDCGAGQNALYLFEFDATLGIFPATPTSSWNINLPGGVDESGDILVANIDGDARPELVMALYSLSPAASHIIVAEIAEGSDAANPNWHVEMDDNTALAYYCYGLQTSDLDGDGKSEIIAVEWNYYRMVIWENSAEDNYAKVNEFYVSFDPNAFSNEAMAEADFDGNGQSELYLASTEGYLWVVANVSDVSQMNFASHFYLLGDYQTYGGFNLVGLRTGNADSPTGQTPDGPDIYLCATDSTATQSAIFDWEFTGGEVNNFNNYELSQIYATTYNGSLFMPSKMAIGDANGDGKQEIVVGSMSLSTGTPHVIALTADGQTAISPDETPENSPENFALMGNYPNPFNPATHLRYRLLTGGEVQLNIFDANGKMVKTLVREQQSPGEYDIEWDGRDSNGAIVASGLYFSRLQFGNAAQTRKMMLVR